MPGFGKPNEIQVLREKLEMLFRPAFIALWMLGQDLTGRSRLSFENNSKIRFESCACRGETMPKQVMAIARISARIRKNPAHGEREANPPVSSPPRTSITDYLYRLWLDSSALAHSKHSCDQ
jgi:hypothetical protein